jgi:hypothetical protein
MLRRMNALAEYHILHTRPPGGQLGTPTTQPLYFTFTHHGFTAFPSHGMMSQAPQQNAVFRKKDALDRFFATRGTGWSDCEDTKKCADAEPRKVEHNGWVEPYDIII